MNLVELFCHVDDFCQAFEPLWIRDPLRTGRRHRCRAGHLCLSERMTLLIWFHQSQYRTFKAFYLHHVCKHLRGAFPRLVSYGRFVELIPSTRIPLWAYLRQCQGVCTGISFIDSTPLAVCHPRRQHQHANSAHDGVLSSRLCWPSVILVGSISTGSLPGRLDGARVRPAGFLASSSISSAMSAGTCSTWR